MNNQSRFLDVIYEIAKTLNISEFSVSATEVVDYIQNRYEIKEPGKLSETMFYEYRMENPCINEVIAKIFAMEAYVVNIKTQQQTHESRQLESLVGENISVHARNGKYDSLIERPELKIIWAILNKSQKSNVLLIGPTRSGKTSIAHTLARNYPEITVIFQLGSSFLSGSCLRGQAEEKIQQTIDYAKGKNNLILFWDECHYLLGNTLGNTLGNNYLKDQIKPALSEDNIRIIAATTEKEFNETIAKDDALVNRFTILRIQQMPEDLIYASLFKRTTQLLAGTGKHIETELIKKTYQYCEQLFEDTSLDKFIDVIDLAIQLAENQIIDLSLILSVLSIYSGKSIEQILNI